VFPFIFISVKAQRTVIICKCVYCMCVCLFAHTHTAQSAYVCTNSQEQWLRVAQHVYNESVTLAPVLLTGQDERHDRWRKHNP